MSDNLSWHFSSQFSGRNKHLWSENQHCFPSAQCMRKRFYLVLFTHLPKSNPLQYWCPRAKHARHGKNYELDLVAQYCGQVACHMTCNNLLSCAWDVFHRCVSCFLMLCWDSLGVGFGIAWGEQESKKLLYKEPTMESECIALAIGVWVEELFTFEALTSAQFGQGKARSSSSQTNHLWTIGQLLAQCSTHNQSTQLAIFVKLFTTWSPKGGPASHSRHLSWAFPTGLEKSREVRHWESFDRLESGLDNWRWYMLQVGRTPPPDQIQPKV